MYGEIEATGPTPWRSILQMIKEINQSEYDPSDWEVGFLDDMAERLNTYQERARVSEKQFGVLVKLHRRAKG